jgi:hypothetical protein
MRAIEVGPVTEDEFVAVAAMAPGAAAAGCLHRDPGRSCRSVQLPPAAVTAIPGAAAALGD